MAEAKGPRKARPLLDDANSKFARALGSVDFHTREAGLRALQDFLSRRSSLEELEMLRLWKGIFYCFWHSDKQPVQAALAERLSEIMTQLPEEVGWLFYATFVHTMRREWLGIDHLRLDKFMMLIRKFFAATLRQLQAHDWQARRVQRLADFWLGEILVPSDTLAAAGVAFHLADLLLPELAKCVAEGGGGAAPDDATLRALLEPFCRALAAAATPAMIHRLRQGVFDPLVDEVRQPGEAAALRSLDAAALASHLFDLGAQADTKARNREALYAVSAALEKAAAAAAGGGQRQRKEKRPKHKAQQEQQQQPQEQQQQQQVQQQGEGEQTNGKQKTPKSARNKALKQQEQQAQQQQQQQQQQEAAPMDAEPTPQHHAADGRQQQQDAAAAPPTSGKKSKKRRQAEAEAQAAAASPLAATPQPAGPPPSSSGKEKKKSRLGAGSAAEDGEPHVGQQQLHDVPAAEQELLAAALAAVTGGAGAGGVARTPGTAKKSVRFSLKRNLVNVIGQPPKPADVRTPPTAKPKGPALKKEGLIGGPASAPERLLTRAGAGRMAQFQTFMNGRAEAASNGPASASKAEGGRGAKRSLLSRPKASDFF
ncbi:hypothetical protein ABPG75_012875 [Micractinium tetrahymenae]